MVKENEGCTCGAAPKLIFACSGAADVGRIADMAARTMTRDGAGKMYCLAGIGGRVSGIVESTKAASRILAIDGCDLECARLCLEHAGINEVKHLRLDRLGLKKGEVEVTGRTIAKVVEAGTDLLT